MRFIFCLGLLFVLGACNKQISYGDCYEVIRPDKDGGGWGMTYTVDDVVNDVVYYSLYAQVSGANGQTIKVSAGYGSEAKKQVSVAKFQSMIKEMNMKKIKCN